MNASQLVLDVNDFHPITTAELRAVGPAALIAKCTEGVTYVSPTYRQHLEAARAVGIPFGAYLFLHPATQGSEARYFLQHAGEPDFVAVDVEQLDGHPMRDVAHRALSCLTALEHAGYGPARALLYCSSSWWRQLVAEAPELKRWPVWEAQYPGRFTRWLPALARLRVRLRGGASVWLWQWTDRYAAPGGRSYDASRLYVPVARLRAGGAV